MKAPRIYTCGEWGARRPRQPPIILPQAERSILHGTDGHVPHIPRPTGESLYEAMTYARRIQDFHMDTRGWNDSGHNFLIVRTGEILQGRWMTVSAIEAGHMVESAHCPGQNGQVGVELEHAAHEKMTRAQIDSYTHLNAWIAHTYHRKTILPIHPHDEYFATDCPVNLAGDIPQLSALTHEVFVGATRL